MWEFSFIRLIFSSLVVHIYIRHLAEFMVNLSLFFSVSFASFLFSIFDIFRTIMDFWGYA